MIASPADCFLDGFRGKGGVGQLVVYGHAG